MPPKDLQSPMDQMATRSIECASGAYDVITLFLKVVLHVVFGCYVVR